MDHGTSDRTEGKFKEVGGKVQQGLGDITGDEELKAEGESNEAKGKAQGFFGKVKDAAGDVVDTAKGAAENAKDKVAGHDHDRTDNTSY